MKPDGMYADLNTYRQDIVHGNRVKCLNYKPTQLITLKAACEDTAANTYGLLPWRLSEENLSNI